MAGFFSWLTWKSTFMTLAESNPPQSWCFRKALGKTHTQTPLPLFGLRKSATKNICKTLHPGKLRGGGTQQWRSMVQNDYSLCFLVQLPGFLCSRRFSYPGCIQKSLEKKLTSWSGCFNFQREFSARISFLKIWHIRIFRGHLCVSLWEQIEKQNQLKQLSSWQMSLLDFCWGVSNPRSLKTHVTLQKGHWNPRRGGSHTQISQECQVYANIWYDMIW